MPSVLRILKKVLVDAIIERTKKNYFWCFNVVGMYLPFLAVLFKKLYVRRFYRIEKDGRVGLMQLNSGVVNGCILRCEYCSAYSPYLKGYVPADELIASWTAWRKKLKPRYFVYSGGEPLLHPELARIVREGAKIWNDSMVQLLTNGLLLERVKPEVLYAIRDTHTTLFLTEHSFEPEHRIKFQAGCDRLKQEGIPFFLRPSRLAWAANHQYIVGENEGVEGQDKKIAPFNSVPQKALNNPGNFCFCQSLRGDKLYYCSYLAGVARAVKVGALDAEIWKAAMTYEPLTLKNTSQEILEHLLRQGLPECTVCPDKNHIVPSRQLPPQKRRGWSDISPNLLEY